METMLLTLDAAAVVVLVWTSLRNDRLRDEEAQTGPFRFLASAVRQKRVRSRTKR